MDEKETSTTNKGGVPSKQAITLRFNAHADEALNILLEIMRNPNSQDSVRMSAAAKILDKSVPDIKAMEVSGPDGGPLQLKYIIDLAGGYIPPLGAITASPAGSNTGSTQVQSPSVAPESTEDNNSTNGAG